MSPKNLSKLFYCDPVSKINRTMNEQRENMVFVAMDTYMHTPRNFFGVKKHKAPKEVRPLSVAIGSMDEPYLFSSIVKGAKMHEDPVWHTRYAVSRRELVKKPRELVSDIMYAPGMVGHDLVVDYSSIHTIRKFISRHPSANLCSFVLFDELLRRKLASIPTSHFIEKMEGDTYQLLINVEEGQSLMPFQKQDIFQSHRQFQQIADGDSSIQKIEKMKQSFRLLSYMKLCGQ